MDTITISSPQAMNRKSDLNVLSFFLDQERYAIPVTDICEVNRMPASIVKNLKHGLISGLLNLHGTAVCILNLKQALGFEKSDLGTTPGWIAVKKKGMVFCLAVDGFSKFLKISGCNQSCVPTLKKASEEEAILFYGRVGNELIPVLNTDSLANLFRDQETDPKLR